MNLEPLQRLIKFLFLTDKYSFNGCSLLLFILFIFVFQGTIAKGSITLNEQEKAWIQQHSEVLVGGGLDWAPFDFQDKKKKYQGIADDYLRLIANKTGLKFKVVVDQWSHNLDKIKRGKIDLLPAVYYTDERSEFLIYSEPYFRVLDYFFVRDDLTFESFSDLSGKTVAIPKDFVHIDFIHRYFPDIKIYSVNTFNEAIDAVINHKADLLYDTYAALSYTLRQRGITSIIPFKSTRKFGNNSLYFVTTKQEHVLSSIIQKGLNAITQQEKQNIYHRWLQTIPQLSTAAIQLTNEEQNWLEQHSVIKLEVDAKWHPFEFINQKGEFDGFAADVLTLIEKKLPIRFDINSKYNWVETLNKIKNKEIDVISSVAKTSEREQYINFTVPFLFAPNSIFTKKNTTVVKHLEDLEGKTAAIEKHYFFQSWLSEHYPKIKLKLVSTTLEALQAVSYGQVDAYVGNQAVALWIIGQNAMVNIDIKPLNEGIINNLPLMIGVRKDWSIFRDILNKALNSISTDELSELRRKWFGINPFSQQLSLSLSERQWLEKHHEILYSGNPHWLPYETYNEDGNYTGIIADYLHLIEEKLNIQLVHVATKSWHETLDKMENNQIDMMSTRVGLPKHSKLLYTNSLLSSPVVIVMKNSSNYVENIHQISNKKIEIIKDYGYEKDLRKTYPDINFIQVSSIEIGLSDVSTGKADALLATLGHASYYITQFGINNIRIVGKTQFKSKVVFAMKQELAPLVALFNQAIASITPKEKQEILNVWTKVKINQFTDYRLLAEIIGLFVLIVILILYWNRKLSKEIKLRKDAEKQIQTVINSIPLQIIVTDMNGTVLSANTKAMKDYEIDANDYSSYNVLNFYADKKDRAAIIKEINKTGKVEQKVIPFIQTDNSTRLMMLTITPIIYQKRSALLALAVDMTERLEIEASLKQAKENAEASSRAKSEFLANMSHEIRTPMNAIIGFAEILDEQISDTKHKGFINTIQSAGNNLLTIINDILDLSKIEAGKLNINKKVCNPYELFTKLVDIFVLKISESEVDFILDIDSDIPEGLLIDEVRLRQVLFNLIGNALKFTNQGYIKLKAYTENIDVTENSVDLIVEVQDTGIGITAEQKEKVFMAFEQSQNQDIKQYGGTGLGLSISQRLMMMMGGEISVKSEGKDKGSTFTIRLNDVQVVAQNNPANTTQHKVTNIEFEPCKILIVDDIENNRELLRADFSDTLVETYQAADGQQAVEMAKNHSFDLILMDIRMPIMDGYQAAEKIKTFSDTPIVALTASVVTDDFERVKSHNFQGYLRKPILKRVLFEKLRQFLPHSRQELSTESDSVYCLDSHERKILPELLIQLKLLLPKCEALKVNNNITDIQQFSSSLSQLVEKYSINAIVNYVSDLNTRVESFDIAGINESLQEFAKLIAQLEELN